MKNNLISFLSFLIFIYLLICTLLYFFQEKLIFFPQTLAEDFTFQHYRDFEERFVEMEDGTRLHALHFKTEDPKGVVFYLHGNAGSLEGWGSVAETFTAMQYDVFIPDYRGYGKSEGNIKGEAHLHSDNQVLFERLKESYAEDQIIILGHSIGSGMAAKVAATNDPKLLILQAPPYSLPDLSKKMFPLNLFPAFLIRYKLETGKNLQQVKAPVVILHGDEDEIVYYGSSLKLKQHFKPGDTLITLKGLGHNNFLDTSRYRNEIAQMLKKHENSME